MKWETVQAIEFHIRLDLQNGKQSPNRGWPEDLANKFKQQHINWRKKIMNANTEKVAKKVTVKKAVVAKKVDKAAVAKKADKKTDVKTKKVGPRGPRAKSTSGSYKSVRNLIERTFAEKKDTTSEEMMKLVKKEFPDHKYCVSNHYPWYKTHIVSRNEWTTIESPKWAKKISAKIKG